MTTRDDSSHPEPDYPSTRQAGRGRRRALVAVTVGALLLAPVAAIASYQVGAAQLSSTSRAVAAVVGAGIMTKSGGSFNGSATVNRSTLALSLHRSIPRIAVQRSLGDLAASSAATDLGQVVLKVDGAKDRLQGVLVSVQMQLDHDNGVASSCNASFQLRRGTSTTSLATWSQELYAGASGEEDNISWSWLVTSKTDTTPHYHLWGANSCTTMLFMDEEIMTAQTFPLNGEGGAYQPAPMVGTAVAKHDR